MQDVVLASDHRGHALKSKIKDYLKEKKYFYIDTGVSSADRPDENLELPPIIAVVKEAAEVVQGAKNFCGIFVCGNGIGMSIAANRIKGVRAALCHTVTDARLAREHNDANVLCLGGENIDWEECKKIINVFLNTKSLNETRYIKRRAAFDKI